MSWPEVALALKEERRELRLSGAAVAKRLGPDGNELPKEIFRIVELNFLEVSKCGLTAVDGGNLALLSNLTSLVLHSNCLTSIPVEIGCLKKLKLLDLSSNEIVSLPDSLGQLNDLQTLNVNGNKLTSLPDLSRLQWLIHLDSSVNGLTEFPTSICTPSLAHLTDVNLKGNQIVALPSEIGCLGALKMLNLENNQIEVIPGELGDCLKLKELLLEGNRLKDRRLAKMISGCHFKPILDYIKKSCPKTKKVVESGEQHKESGGAKKGHKKGQPAADLTPKIDAKAEINVKTSSSFKVVVNKNVAEVRNYIVCCIVRNVCLKDKLKKFIAAQTKLHDGNLCKKRVGATIATHDLSLLQQPLIYSAMNPDVIIIQPLSKLTSISADLLVEQLNNEAEALRKEKKRNTYTGIHQYLYLLKNLETYACLTNADGTVISFPPITNSEVTKISEDTTDIFVEVTSSETLALCKKVADSLLREMAILGLGGRQGETNGKEAESDSDEDEAEVEMPRLEVEQVRILAAEDESLKVAYPAKNDLEFSDIRIIRDGQ